MKLGIEMAVYQTRIQDLQSQMKLFGLDVVIATSPASFYYFTGIWLETGERASAFVIDAVGRAEWLVHKMFEFEVSSAPVPIAFWQDGQSPYPMITQKIAPGNQVAIEGSWSARHLISLMYGLGGDVQIVNADSVIAAIRSKKGPEELALMMQCSLIADDVVGKIRAYLRPGITELAVMRHLESLWQASNAQGLSFSPIIAAGVNTAAPHHEPDDSKLSSGTTVIVDTGGLLQHYCSDTTRTFILGEPTKEMEQVYTCVLNAQLAGIAAAKPGVTLSAVDGVVRKVIENAGYGPYFTHRTGHGIGLEIHEAPFVVGGNEEVLEIGMVITIEPGIYLPGKFGVRIEDTVVVENHGGRPLNLSPKNISDMVISV